MAKIRILIVLEFLFLAKAIESSNVKLCENSAPLRHQNLTCPENKTISWKWIRYGEFPCRDTDNNRICQSNIETYFNDHCLGKNNCTLPIDILYNKSCQRPQRRLKVQYVCSRNWWHFRYPKILSPAPVDTCSKTLANVYCPFNYHIHITYVVSYSDKNGCENMNIGCARNKLIELCNEKGFCWPETNTYSCLLHKRFASIDYVCKGPTDLPVTDIISSSSSDEKLPELSIGDDHRVELYQHSHNQTQYLCSSEWDDFDAGVLCKSFNRTWIGNATLVDKLPDILIAPISVHCGGLETDLFSCNFTVDEKGCNTTKVAGAICCEGTVTREKCVTKPSSNKLSREKLGPSTSSLGVAVGVPVGIIGMVCIIVAVVFIRRRCIRKNSDKKFSNFMSNATDDNYLGQQDIALPQYPTNNKVLYSQVPNSNKDTTKNKDGQDYSHPSKDTESPYALSEEGVYDKTNERRHVVKDTDVYSRTVDTVYDSSEQHMRQDRKEETYDHVFGQTTEDDYDQTTRT
ncbi:unnamed protein product [Mytilus coruscus]|uniref:SRCR domain-containing protein n=1 Tax=Mytilus coruscus TaxID=42192 RepID=A0A6J8DTJ0_MYTCO|nr:unnamed protein product [Mytilus coruscus]